MISIFKFPKTLFALTCILSIVLISCQRSIDDNNQDPGNGTPVNDSEMVTASVFGVVVNENNLPVSGATVMSGTQTTTTNANGVFRFNDISLSRANGTIKVESNGYFNAFRTFPSTAGRTHTVRIQLLPKTNAGNFAGTSGGTINISGGGKLVVPAAAVTDVAGNAYTGSVNVAMTWIDPTATNLASIVIGDLRGLTTDGVERGLSTYGMLGVELTGTGGQPLKIANGKTAELNFPIPASLNSSAPATIDLWHFDETSARWKQEGTATKTGSYYIANVSHFSFWNCDAPFPLIDLCVTLVKSPESAPLNNVQVRIKRTANNTYGYGRTDSIGKLCGKVPRDESLVLEVLDNCNALVYSQNIGPFGAAADIGTIAVTMPAANTLTISGTISNCGGANVTNGAAVVYVTGGNVYSSAVNNGTFSLNIVRCATGTLNFSVLGVDYTTMQQGNSISGSGTTGTVNVGTIQACGTASEQFVNFLIDGSPVSYAQPPDSLTAYLNGTTRSVWTLRLDPPGSNNSSSFTYTDLTTPGTTPLLSCSINTASNTSQQILTASPVVNITAFGPVITGFIEGNFNIQMNFGGTPKTVTCNFKLRRYN